MWPSFLKDAYLCQVLSEKVCSGRGCGFTFLLSQSLEAEHCEFEASLGHTVRPPSQGRPSPFTSQVLGREVGVGAGV